MKWQLSLLIVIALSDPVGRPTPWVNSQATERALSLWAARSSASSGCRKGGAELR